MDFDFIATADLHISDQAPNKRLKEYPQQILDKFEQILEITNKQTKNNLLLVAGDFFDSPTVSYDITREVIKIIKRHNIEIVIIPGQHDMRYHQSGLKNTPLGVLIESELVKYKSSEIKGIVSAGWNDEPDTKNKVLMIHRMVVKKDKLFFDQKDFITAKDLLKKYPWAELIISGDNHTPHLVKYKNRYQLNCGSIVRKNKTQIDYKPAVWGIKLEPKIEIKKIPLKILPSEEVFNFDKIEKEEIQNKNKKEAEEKINNFVKTLPEMDQDKPKFPDILKAVVKETNPGKRVEKIINTTMEKIS